MASDSLSVNLNQIVKSFDPDKVHLHNEKENEETHSVMCPVEAANLPESDCTLFHIGFVQRTSGWNEALAM